MEKRAARGPSVRPILPPCAGGAAREGDEIVTLTRRDSVKQIGGWAIFLGVLGSAAAFGEGCAPEPGVDLPNGTGTPTGTDTATPTSTATGATPTPTGTADVCGCTANPTGTNSGLTRTNVPMNAVAYNSAAQLFVCHDSGGFYCLDALCTHEQCDMGQMGTSGFHQADLGWGFYCNCHGTKFDAVGNVVSGPAPKALPHYQVAFDTQGKMWIDYNKKVGSTCRCT